MTRASSRRCALRMQVPAVRPPPSDQTAAQRACDFPGDRTYLERAGPEHRRGVGRGDVERQLPERLAALMYLGIGRDCPEQLPDGGGIQRRLVGAPVVPSQPLQPRARAGTRATLAATRSKVEDLQRKRSRVLRNSLELDLSSEEGEVVRAKLDMLRQQIVVAEAELRTVEEQSRAQALAWDNLADILNETRNLAEAWDNADLAERKILLDMWVLDVVIVVEPIPGKAKKNRKTAYVTLRSAPDLPRELDISVARARASSNSSRTQESSSLSSRPASTTQAAGEATSPSAQAACPRTNGSGSDSASTSGGTASSDPQLPSATATLRSNPSRRARRTGEPRVNSSHASGDNRMSSTSEGEIIPGRGEKSGSDDGRENFPVNGHTSWQMSQPNTRFVIALRSSRGIGPRFSMVR
jgi:hypothetical protein